MLIEAVGGHLDREQHKSQDHPKTFVISSKKFEELLKSLSNIKAKGGYFQASYNCTNSVFFALLWYFHVFLCVCSFFAAKTISNVPCKI